MEDVLSVLLPQLRGRFGRVLYRYHIPADDGEDLVQTTLLLAVAKWNDIRDPEGWLIGTLQKRCIIYWRARRSQTDHTRPLEEWDLELGVEPDQTRRERFADLGKVWHLLAPAHRKLLLLRFQEGLSTREAAQAVGFACSGVRKTTNRACERLREALGIASPRKTPSGQPAAAPALANRLRAEGGAAAAWMAAVDSFTAAKAPYPRTQLERDLAAAGIALGVPSLTELRIEQLGAFREALAGKTPAVRSQILYGLRSFLIWAGERGDHALQPDAVREALLVGKTIKREAVGTEAAVDWRAAVEGFLAVTTVTAHTRRQYRSHLFRAGAVLGWRPLAELTGSDLLAFRAALLADGRSAATHAYDLIVLRCFLMRAWEQGWLTIDQDVLREELRGRGSRHEGPPTPGRATSTTDLRQVAGHSATWLATTCQRAAFKVPAAAIPVHVPDHGRSPAPRAPVGTPAIRPGGRAGCTRASRGTPGGRDRRMPHRAPPLPATPPGGRVRVKGPGATPKVQAAGQAGSAPATSGNPSGRTRRMPRRAPPLPVALPVGSVRLKGAAAHPKRAVRRPRVGASWKTEVEAYLASFASSEHDRYRCHLLEVGLALAEVDFPQLKAEHLAAYRERLRADGRSQRVHLQALSVLRSFLVWAAARSAHQLGSFEVIAALPLPPIADEDFTRAFVAHFSESLAAGLGTQDGRA